MNAPLVFIADDDLDLCEALAVRCRALGIAAESANDALVALRRIEQTRPNLVILDISMPGGSGLGVCEMMSANERLQGIPVVILTGEKSDEVVRRCHKLKAFFVPKCENVWPRIEPLLREHLDLSDVETESLHPTDEIADLVSHSNDKLSASLELMDAIFEILGGDDRFLAAEKDADRSQVDTPPWVLCIDDDADFSFTLQQRLSLLGVEVVRAFNGKQGFDRGVQCLPQVILLDYEMPDVNGEFVLQQLKSDRRTADIPVIVITGRRESGLENKMLGMGAKAFFLKPYRWPELSNCLKELIQLPKGACSV